MDYKDIKAKIISVKPDIEKKLVGVRVEITYKKKKWNKDFVIQDLNTTIDFLEFKHKLKLSVEEDLRKETEIKEKLKELNNRKGKIFSLFDK